MDRGIDRRRRRRVCDLEIYDFVREPFLESRNALGQVASRLVLRIRDGENSNFRKRMLEDSLKVRREVA